jgi:hypothetical protein
MLLKIFALIFMLKDHESDEMGAWGGMEQSLSFKK